MTVTALLDVSTVETTPRSARYTLDTESYSPRFTVIRATGDIDMTARIDLVQTLDRVLMAGTDVLLDLSAVSFMYSGAASVIVDAASRNVGRVQVFAPTRPVSMILRALGATELLTDRIPD